MKFIQISRDLKLPLDTVLLKKAILAKSGAGKSNTAAVYVESVLDAGVQVIILDPKGDWWGLKSSADGKSAGYPITIFGGDRGDLPLEAAAGALVAQSLVESGASAIIDVSDFSKAEMFRFVGDFCTAFYKAKKKSPTPVLLVFEEADEMAPQKLPPSAAYGVYAAICLGSIEKIIKRGRFIGIGPLVVTQRSASLNKDVLTQTDLLILQQTTAPQDVDAVDAWIEHHPDQEKRKQVLATIQSLPIGHGFVWCPALDLFVKTHFDRRRTFDSGRTPKIGEVRAEPKVLAKVDIERLRGQMATLVEKAKAEDPKVLRARVKELERQLAERPKAVEERVVEKVVEVSVLSDGDRALLQRAHDAYVVNGNHHFNAHQATMDLVHRLAGLLKAPTRPPSHPVIAARPVAAVPVRKPAGNHVSKAAPSNMSLPKGELATLTAVAEFENGVEREQLTVLTGYKRSSRDSYVQRLRERGYVYVNESGRIQATDAGLEALGPDFKPLPRGQELRDIWLARLPDGEKKVLEVLLEAHPEMVAKETIDERTGYKRSSRDSYIQRLRSKELVVVQGGSVRATDRLFEG